MPGVLGSKFVPECSLLLGRSLKYSPQYFARKYISKSEESSTYWSRKRRDFMNRELSFLKKFQHPNTLKYVHHLIPSPDAKELYIWTELCKYGDLHRLRR
jgi:hypothetical protein